MSPSADADKLLPRPGRVLFVATGALPGLLVLGLTGWYLAAARQAAGEYGLPLDDGWIHARFAQNLARGDGFSFNPGQATSLTTGPLWTLLLGLGYRVTGEAVVTGIALNIALALCLLALTARLIGVITGRPWLGVTGAGLLAVTVPLPWWVLSGMEPLLYATLALGGIVLQLRPRTNGLLSGLPATGMFALAGLARPEMLLLFPLAATDRLLQCWRQSGRAGLRRWGAQTAINAVLFTLLVAPMFLYNYHVSGLFLPSSFYSKLQRAGIQGARVDAAVPWSYALVWGPFQVLWEVFRMWWRDNCLLGLTVLAGFYWSLREWRRASEGARASLLLPLLVFVQPLAWGLVGGYRPPDYQSQRYFANLQPLFIIFGLIGAWWVTGQLPALRRPRVRGLLLVMVVLLSVSRQPAGLTTYAKNVKNTTEMQVAIARWLKEHAPPDSLLAVNDIGAIGYITDMPVLDLQGLVTPEILPRRDLRRRADGSAPAAVLSFLADHRPDYLVIFPQWYPDQDARRDLFTPVHEVVLPDNITNGAPLMRVYRTGWAGSAAGNEGVKP